MSLTINKKRKYDDVTYQSSVQSDEPLKRLRSSGSEDLQRTKSSFDLFASFPKIESLSLTDSPVPENRSSLPPSTKRETRNGVLFERSPLTVGGDAQGGVAAPLPSLKSVMQRSREFKENAFESPLLPSLKDLQKEDVFLKPAPRAPRPPKEPKNG